MGRVTPACLRALSASSHRPGFNSRRLHGSFEELDEPGKVLGTQARATSASVASTSGWGSPRTDEPSRCPRRADRRHQPLRRPRPPRTHRALSAVRVGGPR